MKKYALGPRSSGTFVIDLDHTVWKANRQIAKRVPNAYFLQKKDNNHKLKYMWAKEASLKYAKRRLSFSFYRRKVIEKSLE